MSNQLDHVADRIHSAAIHLLRRVREEDVKSGLSPARLSALSVLVFAGPMTLGDLAAAEHVRPPTMTKIVRALEDEGLVSRRGARDRRSVVLSATAKGARLLQRARERRVAVLTERLGDLAPEDVLVLARAAELMEEAVRRRT